MNWPFRGLLVASVAIAVIVGGCGGSDDSTTDSAGTDGTTSSELSKAQFLKQGNAICAKANEEIGEEVEKFIKESGLGEKQSPSAAELKEVAEDVLAPIVGRQVEEIRDLGAPAGEEEKVDRILSAAEEGVEKGEEDPESLLGENGGPFAKANQLAKEYGLKTCGE